MVGGTEVLRISDLLTNGSQEQRQALEHTAMTPDDGDKNAENVSSSDIRQIKLNYL